MYLRKCENCGGELGKQVAECPACDTPVSTGARSSFSGQRGNIRLSPVIVIGIGVACVLVALLVTVSIGPRLATATKPEVAAVPDVEGIKAKAESGDADAQKALGKIYAKGDAVKQDYAQAAKWYRVAADKGHAAAQAALGELYEAGQGVPQDDAEAAKWYRQAAEQGNVTGQYSLAVLYVMGKGVPRDNTEALKWYREAANQGDDLAQYNLGMRYYEGSSVAADPVEAYKWLSLAADQGVHDAVQVRDALKSKMTREQLAEGRRRAESFVAKQPAR